MRIPGCSLALPLLLLAVTGCGARHPATTGQAAAAGPGAQTAVIVAVRTLPPSAGDIRASILAALGTAAALPAGTLREVILRVDGGQTLSVVQQEAAPWLAPGARVALQAGPRTRLAVLAGG